MGKIIQLDETLTNKIAAGEVVERPASVVKELVENSIDARSTVIEVEILEAGLKQIRVIDNGEGMSEEDAVMAFERHATSKIKSEEDLFRIRTLGFRGEALPSIASVSRMELSTSTGEGPGTRLVLEGGTIIRKEPCSSRKGTEIVVSDLFYNTPARLKYMKSLHTELSNITDFFNRLALSHPDVAMKLSHNGRTLIKTTGNGDIRQVMRAIYGLETARKMIPVEGESLDFRLTGYISLPEVTRASRNYLLTSVNGRFIRNYTLNQAILAGYHTLLPIGRFPICYLHIEMDPILVDVNVHPSKLEVRFSKEKELAEWITSRIRESFRRLTLIPEPKPKPFFPEKPAQLNFSPGADLRGTVQERKTLTSSERKIALTLWKDGDISITREARVPESLTESEFQMTEEEREGFVPDSVSAGDEGSGRTADNGESRVPPLRPIGQMHGTYILAENENGLYIIDQHAAQERIKFEFYRKKLGEVPRDLQDLLFPLTLELSNEEYVKLSEYLGELQAVGVFLEPFGQQTYIVRSHPQWFPKGEEEETIREIIDQVLEMKKVDLEQLRERTAMMMSCKGSIKANQYLRKEEIEQLLNDLRRTANPFTCPHGRPVIIHFSNYELEKMFKRVM